MDRSGAVGGGAEGPLTQSLARVEWPTLAVAAAIYGAFAALTWWYAILPWWLVLPAGAYVVCWHGSLQHETVHGHPTPWRGVNEALVFPSLWLWLPYRVYRESHLIHHRDEMLTCPVSDPETYYVTPERWRTMHRIHRALRRAYNTVLGRLAAGPPVAFARLLNAETARLRSGDRSHLLPWALHLAGAGTTIVWAVGICGIPFVEYVLFFAYPGVSLTLLRSFAEHRAAMPIDQRTAVVETGPVLGVLYLYNNLHALHHSVPREPWYALPGLYRNRRDELLASNAGYLFRGYWEVVLRYFVWPKEEPAHPFFGAGGWTAPAAPPTPVSPRRAA